MAPRPPLDQRLPPGQRLALRILAGLGYGLVCWVLFAHKITPWPLGLSGTVLVALPVAAARHRPVLAFAAGLAAFWLTPVVPALAFLAVAPLGYVLYEIAGRYRPRAALPLLAAALTGPVATAFTGHAGGVLPFAVALVLAWTVGYGRGEHRRYGDELVRHHAGLAEVERERARRGVVEERLRIARELHDVVAHSMSVITVQAGFGHLVVDERPDDARAALAAIETTGRQTLAELRRLLGVLRADGAGQAGLAPAPGLADLPDLVAHTQRAGVRVTLATSGEPREVPAGVGLTAYRIVQEALTNVVNHAGRAGDGAPVTARVTLDHRPDGLAIEIVDDGCATLPGAPPTTGGLGLTGMRERAQLYGGEVEAGPLPGGGFRVAARVPVPQHAGVG